MWLLPHSFYPWASLKPVTPQPAVPSNSAAAAVVSLPGAVAAARWPSRHIGWEAQAVEKATPGKRPDTGLLFPAKIPLPTSDRSRCGGWLAPADDYLDRGVTGS